jgi:hypothetical protein
MFSNDQDRPNGPNVPNDRTFRTIRTPNDPNVYFNVKLISTCTATATGLSSFGDRKGTPPSRGRTSPQAADPPVECNSLVLG